ncbi:hypothetical protein H9Y04_36410 [Streptomyces sp. TRM66268-LWL]|uniref:HTH marR-type domain-containing protein n=1 Tax=Streptomyces polyasparticus TaxID=2767826 RepID=A0ABR7SU15_9ACTN|nr:hypothetical protein [Streptomyces polyasparticus]MBC9718031.1 hypothetical protein [Streptomyces polyasparticus]
MSKNPTTEPCTLQAVPQPQPLTGLTGAPAAVYTELAALTAPATTAELALATGLGRSTVGNAVALLEKHGLAQRTPGGHEGARRVPDRWQIAPADGHRVSPEPHQAAEEPSATGDDPSEPTTMQATSTTDTEPEAAAQPAAAPEDAPDAEVTESEACSLDTNEPPVPHISLEAKQRLAPGALRQMVIDYLEANPEEAFTATRIGRVLGKSSGAVANALTKIASEGGAEQVTECPRTYRWVKSQTI